MNDDQKPQADPAADAETNGVPEELLLQDTDAVDDGLDRLRSDLEAARQDVLYAKAETQNVRRRMEKDVADARAYAATGFARDILSVSDNLSRALGSIPQDLREDEKLKNLVAGLEATAREIDKVFATPHRRNGPAARSEPAPGHARSALCRCRTGHRAAGTPGWVHD